MPCNMRGHIDYIFYSNWLYLGNLDTVPLVMSNFKYEHVGLLQS